MIRAILFDLDGILVNASELHYNALNTALLEIANTTISKENHLRIFNGWSTKRKLKELVIQGQITTNQLEEIFSLKQKYTQILARTLIHPDPTKIAMCRELSRNYSLAVVSNCIRASIDLLLSQSRLAEFMSVTVSNQDVKESKPAPDGYVLALALLGMGRSEAWAIEDNEKGVIAAQDAGIKVWQTTYEEVCLTKIRELLSAMPISTRV